MLLKQLNSVQQEAVKHRDGPLLILAGAGSGKTRIITYRIAYLIEHGVYPQQIFAVTFTNKAAKEMSERISALLGLEHNPVWVYTIHSTCARILRQHIEELKIGYRNNFSIIDSKDQKSIISRCIKKEKVSRKYVKPAYYIKLFSTAKNQMIANPDWKNTEDYEKKRTNEIWKLYHETLLESNCLDFDDLLRYTLNLFQNCPDTLKKYQKRWKYQMVDEFQDVNAIQFEIIKLLAAGHNNLCVVGDDDQSIYKWRGADVENILFFDKDFPGARILVLDQNYRSTQNIIKAASCISNRITVRREKNLWTENKKGSKISLYYARNEYDEAHYIARTIGDFYDLDQYNWDEFTVLYRTNAQSRILEEEFRRNSIPYYLVGEISFYKRKEVKDLLAYLQLLSDPFNQEAFIRVINTPARGIGKKTLEKIIFHAEDNNLPLLSVINDKDFLDELSSKNKKNLSFFYNFIQASYQQLKKEGLKSAIKTILDKTEYINWLKKDNEIQAQTKIENISQLVNAVEHFEAVNSELGNFKCLIAFLQEIALSSEADEYDKKKQKVTLMTLHLAKGLEFPIVFLAGMVEGLLPHSFSLRLGGAGIDEERRLAYVGITRAGRHLFLTCPIYRKKFGTKIFCNPSRFINDIPKELLDITDNANYKKESYKLIGNMFNSDGNNWKNNTFSDQQKNSNNFPDSDNRNPKYERRTKPKSGVYLASTGNAKYRLGTRIIHSRWGKGMVIGVNGSGERTKLIISFPSFGRKTIIANAAHLKIIEF